MRACVFALVALCAMPFAANHSSAAEATTGAIVFPADGPPLSEAAIGGAQALQEQSGAHKGHLVYRAEIPPFTMGAQPYQLAYRACLQRDAHPDMIEAWAAEGLSGIGMSKPVGHNWYSGAFIDARLDGQSLQPYKPELTWRRFADREAMRAVWNTPRGRVQIDFIVPRGSDVMLIEGRWDAPQLPREVEVALRAYPGGYETGKAMRVHTARDTWNAPTKKTLRPGDAWLLLTDETPPAGANKKPRTNAACGAWWPTREVSRVSVNVGEKTANVEIAYPGSAGAFRLAVWDFHGLANAAALAQLQTRFPILTAEAATMTIGEPAEPVAAGDHPPGVLIEGGKAHATIVIPARAAPAEAYAAADFQRVLFEMTGVRLPVATDDALAALNGNRVLIGETRLTDAVIPAAERKALARDGFVARLSGRELALAGAGPYGPMNACAELYERLGARWYMPGDLGACVPRLDAVRFENLDARREPSFAMRWVGKDFEWNLRNRTNRVEEGDLPPGFQAQPNIYHTQSRYVSHAEFGKTHPEYFALIKGERSTNPDCKLCNSNPELPKVIAAKMADMLRADPSIDLISLSPTDFQLWCECDECKKLDEPEVPKDQKYSRRQLILYNRVAAELEKEFPNQRMLVGAYNVYNWPPKDPALRAHRNLAVVICHYEDYCLAHPVADPTCTRNRRYLELIRAWQQQTPDIYFYEYYYKVNWLDLPWPIVHTIAADIPFFKSVGVKGLYTQYSPGAIWGDFLAQYVAARLLWDHATDVSAVLDEFYPKFYGAAAAPMRRWHELLEQRTSDSKEHFPGGALKYAGAVFSDDVLRQMKACVDEAQSLNKDDLIGRRLERMALLTDYTTRLAAYLHLRAKAATLKGDEQRAMFREALALGDALRDDVLKNRAHYQGVASAAYFGKDKYLGRDLEKLRQQVAGGGAAAPATAKQR